MHIPAMNIKKAPVFTLTIANHMLELLRTIISVDTKMSKRINRFVVLTHLISNNPVIYGSINTTITRRYLDQFSRRIDEVSQMPHVIQIDQQRNRKIANDTVIPGNLIKDPLKLLLESEITSHLSALSQIVNYGFTGINLIQECIESDEFLSLHSDIIHIIIKGSTGLRLLLLSKIAKALVSGIITSHDAKTQTDTINKCLGGGDLDSSILVDTKNEQLHDRIVSSLNENVKNALVWFSTDSSIVQAATSSCNRIVKNRSDVHTTYVNKHTAAISITHTYDESNIEVISDYISPIRYSTNHLTFPMSSGVSDFHLHRLKMMFNTKYGEFNHIIGGEVLDVSIPTFRDCCHTHVNEYSKTDHIFVNIIDLEL
jgi:hypothetical protein